MNKIMSDKEKIDAAILLIEEMLGVVQSKDDKHKEEAISRGQGEQAVGDSWEIFYLTMLKKILEGKEL